MQERCPVRVRYEEGQGASAVFVHANGFVPRIYTPFFEALGTNLRIQAPATRGQNGYPLPRRAFSWKSLGHDIGAWVKQSHSKPIIGMGHSMGATALIFAAQRYPEAFRALVLIEPASISPLPARLIRLLPLALLKKLHPMRGAVQKRDQWPNREAFLESCRRSGLYKKFDTQAMNMLCEHMVEPTKTGLKLVYPKMWEAYNYSQVCDPVPTLAKLPIPVLGIRAADSFFMNDASWARFKNCKSMVWQRKLSSYGHLVPLEGPTDCANCVQEGLDFLDTIA